MYPKYCRVRHPEYLRPSFDDDGTGLYPHDVIKNVPYSILKEIATNAEDWVTVKKILRTYISQGYYTEAQLGYLLADWDEFFARNPS